MADIINRMTEKEGKPDMTLASRARRQGAKDVDMTSGNIFMHLLRFTMPLLVGNIFQQLYNTVDAWVVGNFVSNEAFSAVGTVAPIINTLIGFFLGLSSGAGVVISQYYGARQTDRVHDTVHTSVAMTLILGAAFTVIGIVMTPAMLRLMKVPAEVMPEATTYLIIYFAGVLGLMLYNMGAGILRAVGDSQHPFYYLVVCAVLNTVLDLLFVLAFDMGVAGVAYATILSQIISAILVFVTLMRTSMCVKFSVSHLRIYGAELKKIIHVGIPAAIQMAVTSFSNVFVQSYINYFGADCMSGWTAYSKVDQVMLLPVQSLALAATTFVGQNLGINDQKRAKKGVKIAILMGFVSTAALIAAVVPTAPYLVRFFNSKPEVVEYGTRFLRIISPCYMLCVINQILAGALRGAGDSRACMITMLGSFVVFRQIYLFVMANFISNTVIPIVMGYPAGWLVASVTTGIYFLKADIGKNRIVDDSPAAKD